jgi:23S rRNA-/tRNA-specific pseudouridylate synthase
VRRYNYGTRDEWQDHLNQGHVWVERGRNAANQRHRIGTTKADASSMDVQSQHSHGSIPPAATDNPLTLSSVAPLTICRDADEVLLQGDMIVFNPPRSLEPDVDSENIVILYMDDNMVCCVKNGAIPVAEGGRYANNTLASILAEWPLPDRAAPYWTVERPLPHKRTRTPETIGPLFPVHRLDRETSGIVVLARNKASAAFLAAQFHHEAPAAIPVSREASASALSVDGTSDDAGIPALHAIKPEEVVKVYLAIVQGVVSEEWIHARLISSLGSGNDAAPLLSTSDANANTYVTIGAAARSSMHQSSSWVITIQAPLGPVLAAPHTIPPHQTKLAKLRMRCFTDAQIAANEGDVKYAKTELCVVATSELLGLTLVKCRIFTGRTHQIRLHCAHLGFPILGDKMYSTRTPGVVGGSCAVDDDCYLRRVRGQESIQWPISRSSSLTVKRHMLHAYHLACTIPPHATSSSSSSSEGNSAAVVTVFEEPAQLWFLRDIDVVVPVCDAEGMNSAAAASLVDELRRLVSVQIGCIPS